MDVKGDTTSPVLVSVFSNRIVVPVFYGVITSILLPATVWYTLTSNDVFDMIGGIIAFIVVALIWLVMVWGELRLKTYRIYFQTNHIEVQSFFGLGKKRIYAYDEINRYIIGLKPAYPLPYESIRLMRDEKKLLWISQFYFRNYKEIKLLITERFEHYQIQKFSLWEAIAEVFE
jgi:hypothetical protein